MMGDITYKTKFGDAVGAKAPDFDDSGTGEWDLHLADVSTIKTAGGLSLMIGAIARWVGPEGKILAGAERIGQILLEKVRASTGEDVSQILREAIGAVERENKVYPGLHQAQLSAVLVALHGNRLYFTQQGEPHAYLVRDKKLIQIAPRTGPSPSEPGVEETRPLQVQATQPVPVQAESGRLFLNLLPGDGIILSGGKLNGKVLARGSQAELDRDFLRVYQSEVPSMIAHGLMQMEQRPRKTLSQPVVVIKTENSSGIIAGRMNLAGLLWQAGVIAAILVISAVVGLVAAYGVPKLMEQKTVPNTGRSAPVPPGFLSVVETNGSVQFTLPGQDPAELKTGSVVAISPGTRLETGTGTVRIQLSDGTAISLGRNTLIELVNIANAVQQISTTNVRLLKGQMLVDSAQSSGTTTLVDSADPTPAQASGEVFGVQYTPDPNRFDLDCLNGTCVLKSGAAQRTLAAGQQSWVVNGALGGIDTARFTLWAPMCGISCQAPAPTPMPAPYLGAFDWHNLLSPVQYTHPADGQPAQTAAARPVYSILMAISILGFGLFQVIAALLKAYGQGPGNG